MCRLFGFTSRKQLPIHHSLVAADNALAVQSRHHPDGWGIAYFVNASPSLHRGTEPAFRDEDFRALSDSVSSHTVIAHVRQATVGNVCLNNTHPFQHDSWVFAHNGTVYGFNILRPYFIEEISPELRAQIRGATDSEHCFYLFLSELESRTDLNAATIQDVEDALTACLQKIASWCRLVGIRQAPCMNFMVSNGRLFATTRLGRDLFFSARVARTRELQSGSELCLDEGLDLESKGSETKGNGSVYDDLASSAWNERPTWVQRGLQITQVLVASEKISSDDHWEEVPNNAILLVDENLTFRIRRDVANLSQLEHVPMPVSIHHMGIAS